MNLYKRISIYELSMRKKENSRNRTLHVDLKELSQKS